MRSSDHVLMACNLDLNMYFIEVIFQWNGIRECHSISRVSSRYTGDSKSYRIAAQHLNKEVVYAGFLGAA